MLIVLYKTYSLQDIISETQDELDFRDKVVKISLGGSQRDVAVAYERHPYISRHPMIAQQPEACSARDGLFEMQRFPCVLPQSPSLCVRLVILFYVWFCWVSQTLLKHQHAHFKTTAFKMCGP